MVNTLSPKEIYERMKELRNLRKLHTGARERVALLEKLVKEQAEQIILLGKQNHVQEHLIETLTLRVEELERMLFGRRKKKEREEEKESDAKPSDRKPRSPHSYHRPVPLDSEVTGAQEYPIQQCPDCGSPLHKKRTKVFYVEDIILATAEKPLKEVIRHIVEQGYCSSCKKWRSAVPLPTARVILGPRVRLYLTTLAILIRCSFEQIRTLLNIQYGYSISDGEIAYILRNEALLLRPEYEALKERIRGQIGNHYDETSWPVQDAGETRFAWVMTGTETPEAVFLVGRSRGKGNALELKGDSTAVGISDDYGGYRTLFDVRQLCWAHPKRKFRDLAQSQTLSEEKRQSCISVSERFSTLYRNLRTILGTPFDQSGRQEAVTLFKRQLTKLAIPHGADPQKLLTLKESLNKNIPSYLTCLTVPGIPPDNNKAERALRHLVLKRKISFGSRTERGAETTGILASVLLSLWWKQPRNFFADYGALRGV